MPGLRTGVAGRRVALPALRGGAADVSPTRSAGPRVRGREPVTDNFVMDEPELADEGIARASLMLCARHLFATKQSPVTPGGLARFVGAHGGEAVGAVRAESPTAWVRHEVYHLQRLARADRQAYAHALSSLPPSLADPAVRRVLACAAGRVGLALAASSEHGL